MADGSGPKRSADGDEPRREKASKADHNEAPGSSSSKADAKLDSWFYLDTAMNPQGPFTWSQMQDWFRAGYFARDLKVMKVGEEDFVPLTERKEFSAEPQQPPKFEIPPDFHVPQAQSTLPTVPGFTSTGPRQASSYELMFAPKKAPPKISSPAYENAGVFNAATGRFQALTTEQYFVSKGLPTDKAGRQIAQYFDLEAFQERKRREKELGMKPKKVKNWQLAKENRKKKKQQMYVRNLMKD